MTSGQVEYDKTRKEIDDMLTKIESALNAHKVEFIEKYSTEERNKIQSNLHMIFDMTEDLVSVKYILDDVLECTEI